MKSAIVVALTGFALAACVGPKGGGQFVDAIRPQSASDADRVCRDELPNDMIYPTSWPEAHGMSADEQRNQHYRKSTNTMGQPGAYLEPPAPASGIIRIAKNLRLRETLQALVGVVRRKVLRLIEALAPSRVAPGDGSGQFPRAQRRLLGAADPLACGTEDILGMSGFSAGGNTSDVIRFSDCLRPLRIGYASTRQHAKRD